MRKMTRRLITIEEARDKGYVDVQISRLQRIKDVFEGVPLKDYLRGLNPMVVLRSSLQEAFAWTSVRPTNGIHWSSKSRLLDNVGEYPRDHVAVSQHYNVYEQLKEAFYECFTVPSINYEKIFEDKCDEDELI